MRPTDTQKLLREFVAAAEEAGWDIGGNADLLNRGRAMLGSAEAEATLERKLDLARVQRGWYRHADHALAIVKLFRGEGQ